MIMKIKLDSPKMKKIILGCLLVSGFALGFFLPRPFIIWTRNYLSVEDAAYKAVYFLQQEVLEAGTSVELLSAEREGNLYRLKMKIDGQDFLSYLTRDAKFLFPSVLDLNPPQDRLLPQEEKPEIKLFVMSLDPVANDVEEKVKSAIDLFGQDVSFELRYVVLSDQNEDFCWDDQQKYCSFNGSSEIEQNVRELCMAKYYPDKLWDFISRINNKIKVAAEASVLERDLGWKDLGGEFDLTLLESCFEEEATSLLDQQINWREQEYLVRTPRYYVNSFGEYQMNSVVGQNPVALIINGMIYGQNEELSFLDEDDYRVIICQSFKEKNKPELCKASSLEQDSILPEEESINED
jgi:hypothetical protein